MTETTATRPACTVVVDHEGARCGRPAVQSLPGGRFHECDHHAIPLPAATASEARGHGHPATRSTAPFLLISKTTGAIVGYAHSLGRDVMKRAARLGATIVPNETIGGAR